MTEHPTTTPARLTDDDGGTLRVYPWASGRVSLVAGLGNRRLEFGPVERHVLLGAIREVAGETECDAVSPGNGYQCARERGHITEHVAMTMDGEVCDTWPVETDDKPEPAPAPAKPLTAEDFAKEEFARHPGGGIAARVGNDRRAWAVKSPRRVWRSDADMAEEDWSIVTPAPTTPREALALAVDLAYEPEGDTMPYQDGYMMVREDGVIHVLPDNNPIGLPARDTTWRRLLLDPPVTPARPKGAEEIESQIEEWDHEYGDDAIMTAPRLRELANFLAERGVRVISEDGAR